MCGIAHSSVPTGPKTPDNPVQGTKADTHMSWRRTKMRSAAWERAADEGRPSRAVVRDIGEASLLPLSPLRGRHALTFARMGERRDDGPPFPLRQALIEAQRLREDIARLR